MTQSYRDADSSAYERELYLGEGCRLFPVSKEEAEGVQPSN